MKKNSKTNKEKTILFRIEDSLHDKYKQLCKDNGFNMSQRMRNFLLEEIKLFGEKNK